MNVEFLGYYGSDATHADSAWVSTRTRGDEERMVKLLKRLAEDGHHTPFEKSTFHFRIRTDIATHIQLLKHRIGVSVNAESARYKEIQEDIVYVPDDWPEDWQQQLTAFGMQAAGLYHRAVAELTPLLGRKRAKESARFFRPYAAQITSDVTFNWRSFAHFYRLRSAPDAQYEMRVLADRMLQCIINIEGNPFKWTIKAFEF